ncbi:MAG: hypothetical protein HYZ79_07690 [Candidatus Melainabacteria bacterium]|nr:hypothetical protein [Candidatus Melainabacteria bacterium]
MKIKLPIIVSALVIAVFSSCSFVSAQEEKSEEPQFVHEHERSRLNEARQCLNENPGTSWTECRYNCVEVCNEVLETYTRGVCNGVLIQICCGIHPSGCK